MYDEAQEEVFLGKSAGGSSSHVAGSTRSTIDEEVRTIIDECYSTAEKILEENRSKLDAMADALMKYETIDAQQIDDIMEGKTPRPPKGWGGNGSGNGGSAAKPEPEPEEKDETPADKKDSSESGGTVGGPANEL